MIVPIPSERLTLGGKMSGETSKQSLESFEVDSAHHPADVCAGQSAEEPEAKERGLPQAAG